MPGGASISISSLLPEFARDRLYTFPGAWDEPTVARQDCAYTAMNFFNRNGDTNFLDPPYVQQILLRDYVPAEGEPTFGDLIQLADDKGIIFHMSVYLADDFVFTKNGVSLTEPWTIMKLREMMTLYYANRADGQVLILRRKDFAAQQTNRRQPAPMPALTSTARGEPRRQFCPLISTGPQPDDSIGEAHGVVSTTSVASPGPINRLTALGKHSTPG